MAMEGRFSSRAQNVILLSQEVAKSLGHNYVGTEHILLGLLHEGEGIGAKTLKNLGLDFSKVQEMVLKYVGMGREEGSILGFTPRTKKVFELSLESARELGTNYIGTEHLLIGLIKEGEGIASRILKELGLDYNKIEKEILNFIKNNKSSNSVNENYDSKETKNIDKFGRDLTNMASMDKLDPVIGRDKEIQRVIQILSRRTKNNPCLIGEAGVGKTAIAEGLAQKIIEGNIPEILKGKRLISLDMASMLAGSKYRGDFEERIKSVMNEIKEAKNIIIFIDELHTIIGAGASEGAVDASNILKPALARGEIQVIGATTSDEYKKFIEKDGALERRFQSILVEEPSEEDAIEILKGLRDKYEAHHRIKISDKSIEAAVKMSARYITERFLPDKAIDLIDEAASKIRIESITPPEKLKEIEENIEKTIKEKEEAISIEDFENAAKLRDEENKLKKILKDESSSWRGGKISSADELSEEDIAEIIGSWTGIPISKLTEEDSKRLLNLEKILHSRVIGQNEAIKSISSAIRRARVGIKDPKKPIGSFIFLGPTGVGKTELTKALAESVFGDENAMIRIDMSEYMEKHTVSRLIGSPPGYVGYDEGGQLTDKVKRRPYSVVLFDEIEKAHPDVFNILLQILDDGRLTDGKGKTINFKNTIIIMTSNVGASTIKKQKTLGFSLEENKEEDEYEKMKDNVLIELKRTFRPEFLNRLDDIIVFHNLSKQDIRKIVDILAKDIINRLNNLDINIDITEKALNKIADKGYDPEFGARPLKRAIQKMIEDKISEELLKENIKAGDNIIIDLEEEEIIIKRI